jgi:RNA polymerase sigma-70 factor (sigma-E family)
VADSFEDFVLARSGDLVRFGRARCGDRHLAEDLVQSVLAGAHGRWSRIARVERPEAYVRRMIVNEHLSWRRRRSSRELASATPPDPALDDGSGARAERDRLWHLLATLPPKQRAAVALRYYEDLPDREIALLLDCSESTVRSQIARALAALRLTAPSEDLA